MQGLGGVDEGAQFGDFRAEGLAVEGLVAPLPGGLRGWCRFVIGGVLLQILLLQIVFGDELLDQLATLIVDPAGQQPFQPVADGDERGDHGMRTGGQ